jgi:hypothetical protein
MIQCIRCHAFIRISAGAETTKKTNTSLLNTESQQFLQDTDRVLRHHTIFLWHIAGDRSNTVTPTHSTVPWTGSTHGVHHSTCMVRDDTC